MEQPWSIDCAAPNRATAIRLVCAEHLPHIAEDHIVACIAGEDYVWGGRRHPDRPLRVAGGGTWNGRFVSFAELTITY